MRPAVVRSCSIGSRWRSGTANPSPARVAYLPQQLPAAEGMTVRELVAVGRYPWHGALGRFGANDRQLVEEAIALVGAEAVRQPPGGQPPAASANAPGWR